MNFRLVRLCPLLIGTLVVVVLGLMTWMQDTLPVAGLVRRLEWMSHDWRVRHAFRAGAPAGGNLGLVTIDETTLEEVNRRQGFTWPLPRFFFGQLVHELSTQGARAVAMDIFFLDEDAAVIPKAGGGTTGSDDYFAQEMKRAGQVILGTPPRPGGAGMLELPAPKFREAAASLGHAVGTPDEDGVLRRVKPFVDDPQAGRVWQLGIVLAARGLGIDLAAAQVEPHRILLTTRDGEERVLPLDAGGHLLVDWSLPIEDDLLLKQNLLALLASSVKRAKGVEMRNLWRDHLVVVGSTGTGNNVADLGATPLDENTQLVSTHWNIANSILANRQVVQLSLTLQLGLLTLLTILAGFATWRLRALWATLVVIVMGAAYVLACFWLFTRWRIWVPMVLPVAGSLLMTHASLVAFRSLLEHGRRRRVRSLFGRIVSPDIVELLIQQPGASWEPSQRAMTVFFADIRGFTTFTDLQEQLLQRRLAEDPTAGGKAPALRHEVAQESLNAVNLYLTAIVDAVKRHQGTLDKYIGDCVMAFWGAPLPDPHHAENAVRAAMDAQVAVSALNTRRQEENAAIVMENLRRAAVGEPPMAQLITFTVGIALNSGMMTVGFMGSEDHLSNYTVFGREVNIASRLEHLAAGDIIITSEATLQEVGRTSPSLAASFVNMSTTKVKGIIGELPTYEISWKR